MILGGISEKIVYSVQALRGLGLKFAIHLPKKKKVLLGENAHGEVKICCFSVYIVYQLGLGIGLEYDKD